MQINAICNSGDRQKCIDAGCDKYTTKPINRQSLIELVEMYGKKSLRAALPPFKDSSVLNYEGTLLHFQ